MPTISLALPAGSLQDQTLELMRRAGAEMTPSPRSYNLASTDISLSGRLIRPQEIGPYVEQRRFDAGVTGLDWIVERGARVKQLAELPYAKTGPGVSKWVLAVPEAGEINNVAALEGKRVATEVLNLSRAYFLRQGVRPRLEFSWGATESKADGLVDAIIDVTETGSSLRANRLKVLDTLFVSTPRLITNRESYEDPPKRERINALALALRSIIEARERIWLEMNVPTRLVDDLIGKLPAMTAPDIIPTREEAWTKLGTIIERKMFQRLLPVLRAGGAQDIVCSEIQKAVPNGEISPKEIDPQQILFGNGLRVRNVAVDKLNFAKGNGVLPCIVQDAVTQQVLMLNYMNREAFEFSCESGLVTFWSRTRQRRWTKGETSGNYLRIVDMQVDCDNNTLLVSCVPVGPTCHLGKVSCFDADAK